MIDGGWRGEGTVLFGGSGFVGSAILRLYPEMISAGRRPPAAPNRHIPIADLGDLSPLRDVPFHRVINCTGTSRHVELMSQPLEAALDRHLTPSIQLLEQLRHRPLKSFVRLSTVLLYDETRTTMPVNEDAPLAPLRNRYLMSQYLGEEAAKFCERDFPVATVRLCNLFGPWPAERTDLIHEIIAQLRTTGRATIRTRIPERDFLYVDDAARALAGMALAAQSGVFNLGSGTPTATGTIADVLSQLSGCPVDSREEPVTGIQSIWIDSTRLRAATAWAPQHTLEAGLAKTWEASRAPGH